MTGIPFIDNLNCQVCGVACGTNPANEQFKDSMYLPPLSQEELWDRCWEQATSSNRLAELYCSSIFQHCINYDFTVEECYAAKFVQLGVPIPFYVLESIGQKTAAVGEQVDAVYRSQMCPYRDSNTVIYGDYC